MNRASYREDYYFTLGVRETATAEEIRNAYRALMKQYHPDLNKENTRANERGKRINEAYEVLSDPKKKTEYDNWLEGTIASTSPKQNKEQSSGSWYNNESFHQRAKDSRQPRASDVLVQWYRQQNLLRRLLAPKDFLAATQGQGGEFFTCLRATTDYLDKDISFETREYSMDGWAIAEAKILATQEMREYVPAGFNKETVYILEDATQIDCVACNGQGFKTCVTTETCSPTQGCRRCGGSGTVFDSCPRCGGNGQTSSRRVCYACRGRGGSNRRCVTCGGQGIVTCSRCSGRGSVVCSRCNGTGRLDCSKCGNHGRLVQARFRIHDFKTRTIILFASEVRQNSDFTHGLRNELRDKDFSGLQGELVQEEKQEPDSPDVVRQRRRIERFGVNSYLFQYRKKEVTVNQIDGAKGNVRLCAPSDLPISLVRLSIAVAAAAVVVIGGLSILSLLS